MFQVRNLFPKDQKLKKLKMRTSPVGWTATRRLYFLAKRRRPPAGLRWRLPCRAAASGASARRQLQPYAGAGIVGSCITPRLAGQGVDVTVVEANRPGYGATANSFAWVGASHPGLHEPEPYFQLNALGVQAYRRLEGEYDLGPWFARTGLPDLVERPGGRSCPVAG